MRQTLIIATFTILAACGPSGDRPWDENHDGLVTACEGLNPFACDAAPGCVRAPGVCTMECRDDGRGGCLPCAAPDRCQPLALDCGALSPERCGFMPGCELVTQTVCSAGYAAVEDQASPPAPGCGGGCHAVEVCQARGPVACEQRSVDACLEQPGCALEVGACTFSCDADSPCPPCANSVERCVTVPAPVDDCAGRDPNVCSVDGRCALLAASCAACELGADGGCTPCTPAELCVPVAPPPPTPSVCDGRDLNTCELDGRCRLEAYACTANCESDGAGGCLPCPTSSRLCVPVAP